MDVTLYNISAPPEQVVKITSSTTGHTVDNVYFKEDGALEIERPKLVLKMNDEIFKNVHYNYCYIGKFERYYFITRISTEGGLMIFECEVDPLQSFASDIKNSTQYVIRSEKFYNKLLVDPLLPLHSDHNIDIHPFGLDVYNSSCDHVILETIGKGGTPS